MKKKNCELEFKQQRSSLLLDNFRASIARQSVISAKRAFSEAASSPAPRFWVSEVRALHIIRRMMAGEDILEGMNEEKARMYREIYRRIEEMREKEPETPLGDMVFRVINSPAPSFYMSGEYARKLIREERRKRREKNTKN